MPLFRPLVAAGIILVAFGLTCIWLGSSIITPREEGEGFRIVGLRFIISGIVSVAIGYVTRYHVVLRYLLKQTLRKDKSTEDKYSDWYKP